MRKGIKGETKFTLDSVWINWVNAGWESGGIEAKVSFRVS
jgi:hypothetical protein